ncbi:MAG: biotin/lipoyl-binding protein [Planctomycetota bacterium]|nr:biotin/lipoyl-binding protein [Planctomycetota bacterium]MDA1178379.1 biotin/lipoyl-binding protein [Planctomycetota bacterium]
MPVSANTQLHHSGIDVSQLEATFQALESQELENELKVPRFTEYQRQPAGEASGRPSVTPMPNQPRKGRLLVGFTLAAVGFFVSYSVWDVFFRYSSHGIVAGHVVEVMPAWSGDVQTLHVRAGDHVESGQLLLTLDNPDLRQKVARAEEELRLARATLVAETARLDWQSEIDADRQKQAAAEYHQNWGLLLNEQAQLELAKRRLDRARQLAAKNLITSDDFDSAIHVESGQRQKVAQLETAVVEMRQRAEVVPQEPILRKQQLEPHLFRISGLQAEIVRCHEELARGQIRAPVRGKVIKCDCLPGDHARFQHSMLSLLEKDSEEIVLYLRQEKVRSLEVGSLLQVHVRPLSESISCEVVRVGQEFSPAPRAIERYYRSNEPLLQVFLRPDRQHIAASELCLGAVANLPRSWWPTFAARQQQELASQ